MFTNIFIVNQNTTFCYLCLLTTCVVLSTMLTPNICYQCQRWQSNLQDSLCMKLYFHSCPIISDLVIVICDDIPRNRIMHPWSLKSGEIISISLATGIYVGVICVTLKALKANSLLSSTSTEILFLQPRPRVGLT